MSSSATFIGVIKNISQEKCFGFVDCPETHSVYKRDVFLHKLQVGADYFAAVRKGEVIQFTLQVDEKGQPQAVTVTNERISNAEENGRLADLAFEDYTPPYPPNINRGIKRSYADIQAAAAQTLQPQVLIMPDGQIVYVCPKISVEPTSLPQAEKDAMDAQALGQTMFGSDKGLKPGTAGSGIKTMFDASSARRWRKELTPNPGLDSNLATMKGVVKVVPDEETGYGFVSSPEVQKKYGRDAFLHNKNCPWVFQMQLNREETVMYQCDDNDRGRPYVVRIIKAEFEDNVKVQNTMFSGFV